MKTIPECLIKQASQRATKPSSRLKYLGIWQTMTWDMQRQEVEHITGGLLSMQINKGDRVAVFGSNIPALYYAMTACQSMGVIPVPIYGIVSTDTLAHIMKVINARVAIVQDQQQVDALLDIKKINALSLEFIVYVADRGMKDYDNRFLYSYEDLCQRGIDYKRNNPDFFTASISAIDEDDTALIVFSSGVDADAKGIRLTHKNLLTAVRYIAKTEAVTDRDEVLSFMPISMLGNLLYGYLLSHVSGMCVSYPESSETVIDNLCEIMPSLLYAPSYVYKQIAAYIHERGVSAQGLGKYFYDKYLPEGQLLESFKRSWLAEILIKAPIRNSYGLNRLRFMIAGGDTISTEVFALFSTLGIEVRQIYGTAEASGCITLQTEETTTDNVGHSIDNVEIKIDDNGEILCRGAIVFPGYYGDQTETEAVIDADGWYHTGDIGTLSTDGKLTVLDRISSKSEVKGVVYFPKVTERKIKSSFYIKEVFVTDNPNGELLAIVCIDGSVVGGWADNNNVRYTGYSDLSTKKEVQALVKDIVTDANQYFEENGQPTVSCFIIMERMFSHGTGELTWTNKLRRSFLKKGFSKVIEGSASSDEFIEMLDPHTQIETKYVISRC